MTVAKHRLPRKAVAALPTGSAPPLTEAQFQRQITEYAELCGWEWMHPRAGRTVDSWRTPMSGTMAKGWPDLVLIRDRRLIFMEVKRAGAMATADQLRVLDVLAGAAETYTVRPKDWDFIEAALA
ncbi:MAG: hypothetical protein M3N43_03995 [Actinomycetota bacterium]|nr:hypothetical protein [Actinomycetota bacterium]